MGIDLRSERALGLAEAARMLPPGRNGRPVHVSSLVRAITSGVDGHRLEAIRIGRRWVTTVEAIQRWGEALAAGRVGGPSGTPASPVAGADVRPDGGPEGPGGAGGPGATLQRAGRDEAAHAGRIPLPGGSAEPR
jgi:hypothetical protein